MGRDARVNRESRGLPEGSFILDRYGRPITAGCEMTFMQPATASVLVQSIAPAVQLDPRQQPFPPGMVKIVGVMHFSFLAPKGVPQREFVLARTVDELIAAGMLRERPEGVEEGESAVKVPQAEPSDVTDPVAEAPIKRDAFGPKLIVPADARD